MHGIVAAHYVTEQKLIAKDSIAKAISYHTTGTIDFDLLGKIVYVADAIEIGRRYPNVEHFRKLAFIDIDLAMYEIVSHTIEYLTKQDKPVHVNSILMKEKLRKDLRL